jgi:hypothetical protein
MPAFTTDQISDLELRQIYAWLESLAPPTPTPVPQVVFPTGALMAMWDSVDAVKTASDFAKDLPARQASDDAGRLAILKQYANQAVQKGQTALAQANRAKSEIPLDSVKSDIQQVIDQVNGIIGQANQALGSGSYGAAWPHAAQMVAISRVDAEPLATQAVRDAGVVGTVRVQVTNQAGTSLAGAFVTVLSQHMPLGTRTDAQGRATFSNVAAVPALVVKAYVANLIYHEENANLSSGGTVDMQIAIPGTSVGGQTPSVANAAVSPASGAGNATVTFSLRVMDPQGAGDIAEDQVFALNPEIGVAYVLRAAGNDEYTLQIGLPGLSAGAHIWYLFAVDHECNTSNVLTAQYTVR